MMFASPLWTRRTLLASALTLNACATGPSAAPMTTAETLVLPEGPPLRAWLALPRGYSSSSTRWPLVIFLHGSGERGQDLQRVRVHGPPRHAHAGREYPFVLCSPQLEAGGSWQPDRSGGRT